MNVEQIVAAVSVVFNILLGFGALRNNKKSINLDSQKVTGDELDSQFLRTLTVLEKANEILSKENKDLRERLRERNLNGRKETKNP